MSAYPQSFKVLKDEKLFFYIKPVFKFLFWKFRLKRKKIAVFEDKKEMLAMMRILSNLHKCSKDIRDKFISQLAQI